MGRLDEGGRHRRVGPGRRPAPGQQPVVLHILGPVQKAGGEPALGVTGQLFVDLHLLGAGDHAVMRLVRLASTAVPLEFTEKLRRQHPAVTADEHAGGIGLARSPDDPVVAVGAVD